jgi:hypothetical protein
MSQDQFGQDQPSRHHSGDGRYKGIVERLKRLQAKIAFLDASRGCSIVSLTSIVFATLVGMTVIASAKARLIVDIA